MTEYVPFPPETAALYAEQTKDRYERSRRALASLRRAFPQVGSTTTHKGLAYRLGDGTVQAVYDPYRADYPAGAEPGWATVTRTLEIYPNESHGYRTAATDFEPLTEAAA